MLKVEDVQLLRHMVHNKKMSIHEAARVSGHSRVTIRKYLKDPEPKRRETKSRARPVLEVVAPRIDQIIEEWEKREAKKQRITGSRIHRQLIEEGFQVGVTTVRDYLRERKRQKAEVFIPLTWLPGDAAQVDFFEITVEEGGQRRKAWKFVLRLMNSKRDFAWIYERCDQVAFLDGHVRAFKHFGAVPKRLIYDNLSSAVKKRVGLERELTDRFAALVSHYCFEPCFARPGQGHDKGGVESRGKAIRLQHLTPVPIGSSLGEISQALLDSLDRQAETKRDEEGRGVLENYELERPHMIALPATPFEPRRILPNLLVNRKSQVTIETAKYSVPERWAGLRVSAYVGVEDIKIICRGQIITHPRQPRKGRSISYRHYLAELSRKPQATRQVADALLAELGEPFRTFWNRLLTAMSPLEAARALSVVLGLIVQHGEEKVRQSLERALSKGELDPLALGAALRDETSPAQIGVPESLQSYRVETARASEYDTLFQGGRS